MIRQRRGGADEHLRLDFICRFLGHDHRPDSILFCEIAAKVIRIYSAPLIDFPPIKTVQNC
jgi:hypothetical protein